jgi:hypothetical protein
MESSFQTWYVSSPVRTDPTEKVLRIVNHVNNTTRPGLGSRTPMSLALQTLDVKALDSLGLCTIPPDDVLLNLDLIRD